MYVLPENLRDILKEPIGQLVDEKKLLELLQSEKKIVSVGDQVTYTLLKNDIEPMICIVDYQTKRGQCSDEVVETIKNYGRKTIVVENPQGTITDNLWNAIEILLKNPLEGGVRLEIIGEEDLASLAVIYMASSDVTIIYGLPNKGVLVVRPTNEYKNKIKQVLKKM